jgi:hypothetical protein
MGDVVYIVWFTLLMMVLGCTASMVCLIYGRLFQVLKELQHLNRTLDRTWKTSTRID